jgi:hypothetical protein
MDRKEEKLIHYLEQLPQTTVPSDFSFRVMDRIETKQQRGYWLVNFKKLAIVSLSLVFLTLVFSPTFPYFPSLTYQDFLDTDELS